MDGRSLIGGAALVAAALFLAGCSGDREAGPVSATPPGDRFVWEQLDGETVLITDGFPYTRETGPDVELPIESVVMGVFNLAPGAELPGNEHAAAGSEASSFVPACLSEMPQELNEPTPYDSIGVRWVFTDRGTRFRVGDVVLESARSGASIAFTEQGVLVKDFVYRKAAEEVEP